MPRTKVISDDRVLDAALTLLVERGPTRFTLPTVGEAVGLSPSTLIQRFGSKKKLLDAVFRRATEQLEEAVDVAHSTGDGRRDLVDWLASMSRPMRTRQHVAGNLAVFIEDLTDERRRKDAQRHMSVLRRGIALYLEQVPGSRPELHVAMVEAHWQGLCLQWALCGEGTIESWVSDGLDALLDGL